MLRARDVVVARARGTVLLAALDVPAGEMASITAPNGTGKTTLLRALAGLAPHAGVLEVGGRDLSGLAAEARVREGLALVPAGRRLFGRLSVEQNLVAGCVGLSRRVARTAVQNTFERFPILGERRFQRAGTLSGGEGQVLLIARALISQPRALLVDEPLEGLSSEATERVLQVLRAVAADGAAIVLASPDPVPGARTVDLHAGVAV